ncbi:MAG: 50S ribosomal protein L29 [Halobacteriovoraceae bacterium]|nr:50S ribosomal protein L29 [Halobacteriovoraceae bacterium]
MEMKDIKSLKEKDVVEKVEELKSQLFDMKIQKATSGVDKPHLKKEMKRNIARLLTHKSDLQKNV